jgi:hypothetical protein
MWLETDILDHLTALADDTETPEELVRGALRALAQFISHAQFHDRENSEAALSFALRTIPTTALPRIS